MRSATSATGNSPSVSTPRSRGQACERCWKRKQKCDRRHPECTACVAVGVRCVLRKFHIEPNAKNGGSLSHAAVPSYVDTLKRKRDALEALVRRQRPRATTPSCANQLETNEAYHPERGHTDQNASDNTVQAAMGEIGFLSRSAMAEPRDEADGISQELSIERMTRLALALSGAGPASSAVDTCGSSIAAMVDSSISLQRQVALPFITRFVETIGVQYLHINSKELLNDFDTFCSDVENSSEQLDRLSTVKKFNLYLSVATGLLLSPGSGGSQGLVSSYHAAAVKLFPQILDNGSRIDTLRCMLSLIIYSMHSALGGSTWHLVGIAMKKAIAFSFHKDIDADAQMSNAMLNARRNVFWSLYTIDRTISIIMDRPFSIEDEDMTVLGPEEYVETNSDLACHLVSHARFMSNVRNSTSKSILYHYSNFSYWQDFASGRDPATKYPAVHILRLSCRAMMEILKVKGSITVESNLVRSASGIESDFVRCCLDYVEEEYQRSDRGDFAGGFVDAYDIFSAGVMFVCLTAGKPTLPARGIDMINKCTALLTLLGEKFPGLRVFRRVLWALSGLILGQSLSDPIIQELPSVIPDGIRDLILEFV
ncbi:Fungal Zn(2)-Cys(6) binuclear cluster domain-containing protein [Penicillium ucsense]|uniref:Fungal Zn(2)-Cys(6) binuclear cluster domain-containing protein n=1 Tax=Penicillium ucsense TaxID=2839758 RepID=A0A8J8W454_9EURO|nr:Fungal Zn(2)-Cys(6) binuclear cluster domain-containing protein [Penicillium ucsense]KAF7734020.1 Fungal Zn(2)-Cys(6) binuclear cluster domain-containing protein [Penicillium ucsense]